MLEILYRIYEVCTAIPNGEYQITENRIERCMECMLCETRDQFKDSIKSTWGDNIKFARPKNGKDGDLYCIIIGEHAYNAEKYFTTVKFKCDGCGIETTTIPSVVCRMSESDVRYSLFGDASYLDKRFCCYSCKQRYIHDESTRIKPSGEDEFFVSRDSFSQTLSGYIYKITKKSTGEFYIGQTKYAPMFRWAEHMKTDRFIIDNILDYQFETIELVPLGENILEREKYYIQKYYKENPEKSLNIACTQILQ